MPTEKSLDYLVSVVGINLHGHQRYTSDIDMWIEDTVENRRNLRKGFQQYGMGNYLMLETMQIVTGRSDLRLNNGLQLDLLTQMKGLEGSTASMNV